MTTKICAVFSASAKSASGVSLNDTLMVGPTIHPPLIDVLLRFRIHCVMYRAMELVEPDQDLRMEVQINLCGGLRSGSLHLLQ